MVYNGIDSCSIAGVYVVECLRISLTECVAVIQSCSVEPLPERDTMRRFDGKNVAESIVRYVPV